MARRPPDPAPTPEHGPHTLRVVQGEVVGVFGDDVFVELGPRMQGVLSRRAFERPPRVGERHEFTLRGRVDTLWALALAPRERDEGLVRWEDLEVGSLVEARVTGSNRGGLELKVGPLFAFMPRSHTGLPRGEDLRRRIGKSFTCEVLEIDPERERVVLSRRLVLAREKRSERERAAARVQVGSLVRGRITRIEPYGVFVRFGAGLVGMVHVRDLDHERVEHPSERFEVGQEIEARVLSVKRGGKRIALGVKQLEESPWARLDREHYVGQIVRGVVTRVMPYGAFVRLRPGVEGLLHRSEAALPEGADPRRCLRRGDELALRILALDCAAERLAFSRLSLAGTPLALEELESDWEGFWPDGGGPSAPGAEGRLGRLLRAVLGPGGRGQRASDATPGEGRRGEVG